MRAAYQRLTSQHPRRMNTFRPEAENLERRRPLTNAREAVIAAAIDAGLDAVPHELIVEPRTRATPAAQNALKTRLGVTSTTPLDAARRIELWRLPDGTDSLRILTLLASSRTIRVAQPNAIIRADATADDPSYLTGSMWGTYSSDASISPDVKTNAFGSQAERAWALGQVGSSQVYVGVIDEGIMTQHEDLAANIWINPFDPLDGIDNDGNGYVDDINGWDFLNNDRTVYDGTFDDHGTHVAGTIGAVGGNGLGTAGIAWNVTIIPAKFLGKTGGTLDGAIRAIDYLTDLKIRHGLRIVATNNSWSGGGYSPALQQAIDRGARADILFVAAAGNNASNNDLSPRYPGNYSTVAGSGYEAVISVAALTANGARASYSNYGATTVDIAAPGSGITSTLPGAGNVSKYGAKSGTSMATPHVTGAIALYAAAYPEATAAQIRQALLASAAPTPKFTGLVATNGRLDVGRFLALAPQSGSSDSGMRASSIRSTIRPGLRPVSPGTITPPRWTPLAVSDGLRPRLAMETRLRTREWRRATR